jgi:hypothetical protein
MPGRNGLIWVTAMTIGSLLIGGGAINALAEGRGGGDHGSNSGRANATHQQPPPGAVNQGREDNNNVDRQHDDNEDLVTKPARVTDDTRPCRDDDEHACNNDNNGDNNNHESDNGVTDQDASAVPAA